MLKLSYQTKNIFKTIKDFILVFITAFIIILAVMMIFIKILGWNILSVDSNSMSPQIPIDTLVIVQPVNAQDIQIGDVITYIYNEEGILVTHRVTDIDQSTQTFTTKGDANNTDDPSPVHWDNLVGKVKIVIPQIGKPIRFLKDENNRPLVIMMIILCITPIALDEIKQRRKRKNEQK